MPSAFDSLMQSASGMLDQHFGETVTIQRGEVETTGVTASWTSQEAVVQSPDGIHTAIVDRYWIVRKSRYTISGAVTTPRTGDLLTDESSQTWEVLPANIAPPAISYGSGDEWKIATKKVV